MSKQFCSYHKSDDQKVASWALKIHSVLLHDKYPAHIIFKSVFHFFKLYSLDKNSVEKNRGPTST